MAKKRIIVIGGSAAGPKTAARARRLDQDAEIIIIQKENDFSMASCGYPYYVGGIFDNRSQLICSPTGVIRDANFFLNAKGIIAYNNMEAVDINRKEKLVKCIDLKTNQEKIFNYDKLILCTGSKAKIPPIPGIELEGITTLKSMKDADYLRKIRDEKRIKKAIVVGGGLIGIETCEALQLAGIQITIVEMLPNILPFLDKNLSKLIENHIRSKGANVITNNGVKEFIGENGRLVGVKLINGTELECELAVIAIGVTPETDLARKCQLNLGKYNGILVNEFMQTSDPDIYAAGDCVEVKNLIINKNEYAPLGDLANLQGRVAGENAVKGNTAKFDGTIKTSICKVFDFIAGTTGISEEEAKNCGFEPISVITAGPDRPSYMGSRILINKIIACKKTKRLLGFQCIGSGDASKQIAQAAMVILGKMTIDQLKNADLPYAPPFTQAIDNFVMSVHVLENKMRGLMKGVTAEEVKNKIDRKEDIFLLDVRGPDEFEQMRLGVGETLIPLGALRKRLNELPQDKNKEIICYCKISLRGYEAALLLEAHGWKNVKVMEGGIVAWPYPREK